MFAFRMFELSGNHSDMHTKLEDLELGIDGMSRCREQTCSQLAPRKLVFLHHMIEIR